MKALNFNIVKATMVGLGVISSAFVFAIGGGNFRVEPLEGSKKARVMVTDPQHAEVELSVKDLDGNVQFYSVDLSGTEAYHKVFDFSNLEDGGYKIVAEDDVKIIETYFNIEGTEVKLLSNKEIYKPFFKLRADNKLIISYLNNENQTVAINFEEDGRSFFEDVTKDAGVPFAKIYDVSALPKNKKFTVNVKTGNGIYTFGLYR